VIVEEGNGTSLKRNPPATNVPARPSGGR